MAPEDLRLRFFTGVRTLTDDMMARLVHIDHTRDAALVAQALNSEEILGVASYLSDPATSEAEFAVMVRSDWKGHGVGWMLMRSLVDLARQRGVAKLTGIVLTENTNMLKFCRDLGFSIRHDPNDAATVTASLSLT